MSSTEEKTIKCVIGKTRCQIVHEAEENIQIQIQNEKSLMKGMEYSTDKIASRCAQLGTISELFYRNLFP